MKRLLILLLCLPVLFCCSFKTPADTARYVYCTVNPHTEQLAFYRKDKNGIPYRSIKRLQLQLAAQQQQLVFAMNGGMYEEDCSPLGLYIEKGKTLHPLNTATNAYGNFYMQPNGVFFLTTAHKAVVCRTKDFRPSANTGYATQSGPMLVTDGKINSLFKAGSTNVNIRNGVGILPGGNILFAMSKTEVNFYDFATFFHDMGCSNALYLDGFVSRTYLPSQNQLQTDGNFGVIIAVTRPAH